MKVLILSTYEKSGGAAIAALRLCHALRKKGVDATMLTASRGPIKGHTWQFVLERLVVLFHNLFSQKHLWSVDIARYGENIMQHEAFREADVIHLHWVNQGFLSLQTIERMAASGKRIVWTMHDAWNSTGICHLTMGCQNYRNECGHCKYLAVKGSNDLSHAVWKKKAALYAKADIRFVACSEWLKKEMLGSKLMASQKVTAIPNPIDTTVFFPSDKAAARQALCLPQDKKLLLFVAQDVNNPNKGMSYLASAMHALADENVALVMLGGRGQQMLEAFNGIEVIPLGYVSDQEKMRQAYCAADAFVLPSLSENLPNTIMEAMACGTPCVGFRVGGIPEMISHQATGYVADYCDANDLAAGIRYVIDGKNAETLSSECVKKVSACYSEDTVAAKYMEEYFGLKIKD